MWIWLHSMPIISLQVNNVLFIAINLQRQNVVFFFPLLATIATRSAILGS